MTRRTYHFRSAIKKGSLAAREYKELGVDESNLRTNWPRRLRNALISLAANDPKFIYWIDLQLPKRITGENLQTITSTVERRAKILMFKGYRGLFSWNCFVYSNTPFNDEGNLLAG